MSDISEYAAALRRGHTSVCIRIEQAHDLFGYPPEIVSVGLHAIADGRDAEDAIADYMEHGGPVT